jgi:hypothetical protein
MVAILLKTKGHSRTHCHSRDVVASGVVLRLGSAAADSIPERRPRADFPALCRRRLPETAERDLIGAWQLPQVRSVRSPVAPSVGGGRGARRAEAGTAAAAPAPARPRAGAGGPARCARPRRLARPAWPPPGGPRAVSPGADRARARRPLPQPRTNDPCPRPRATGSGRSNRASALGVTRLRCRQRCQAARRDRPDRALRHGRAACPPRRRRTTRSQLRQTPTPPARPRRQPPIQLCPARIAITRKRASTHPLALTSSASRARGGADAKHSAASNDSSRALSTPPSKTSPY